MIASNVKTTITNDAKYPCLKKVIEEDVVVLFCKEGTGTVLFIDDNDGLTASYPIGYYSDGWNMNDFIDYTGEIILSNE